MKTIYKYDLEITDKQEIETFECCKILAVKEQDGILRLWALVSTDMPKQKITVEIFGTGNQIPQEHDIVDLRLQFIDSVVMKPFVWHVFVTKGKLI
jgi:D-lyxose ketol-isomerase